jgi:hypothetical protein
MIFNKRKQNVHATVLVDEEVTVLATHPGFLHVCFPHTPAL